MGIMQKIKVSTCLSVFSKALLLYVHTNIGTSSKIQMNLMLQLLQNQSKRLQEMYKSSNNLFKGNRHRHYLTFLKYCSFINSHWDSCPSMAKNKEKTPNQHSDNINIQSELNQIMYDIHRLAGKMPTLRKQRSSGVNFLQTNFETSDTHSTKYMSDNNKIHTLSHDLNLIATASHNKTITSLTTSLLANIMFLYNKCYTGNRLDTLSCLNDIKRKVSLLQNVRVSPKIGITKFTQQHVHMNQCNHGQVSPINQADEILSKRPVTKTDTSPIIVLQAKQAKAKWRWADSSPQIFNSITSHKTSSMVPVFTGTIHFHQRWTGGGGHK